MEDMLQFRDALIEYLTLQKELEQRDIERNKSLSIEEKIEQGLLIKDAIVIAVCDNTFELHTEDDNTKLKIGDNVSIKRGEDTSNAMVLDNGLDTITLKTKLPLSLGDSVSIEIIENIYLDSIINLLELMDEGKPGAFFLKQLSGLESPTSKGVGAIDINSIFSIPEYFNSRQVDVISKVLQRPSTLCIQGPPGTGKTAVLSSIALCFSERHKDVLIISNTHQAVNNALEKIVNVNSEATPVKIGERLKGEGLSSNVMIAETYSDYLKERKRNAKHKTLGDIVGMTLHSAIINVGLRNSGFQPQIVLVDEAGQMPMPFASVIGAFGSGSIIFIGDDKQMPPIFHPDLRKHEFSKSIFSYLCERYPNLRQTLNVTYRMNNEITQFVDSRFYGAMDSSQRLISSDFSKNRKFPIEISLNEDETIRQAFNPNESIVYIDLDTAQARTESNPEEAQMAFELVRIARLHGLNMSDIAVITPFRKQVKMIRSIFNNAGWTSDETPLINTVECLQGQDVECIIISLVVSDEEYLHQHYSFIANANRLNVMVSRAKSKVIFIKNSLIPRW